MNLLVDAGLILGLAAIWRGLDIIKEKFEEKGRIERNRENMREFLRRDEGKIARY